MKGNLNKILIIVVLIHLCDLQSLSPYVYIVNNDILSKGVKPIVYFNDTLNSNFDDTIFSSSINCRNNYLEVLKYNHTNSSQNKIIFYYANIDLFTPDQINI